MDNSASAAAAPALTPDLRRFLDALSDPLFVLDASFHVLFLNGALRREMDESDVSGSPVDQILPWAATEPLASAVRRVRRTRQPESLRVDLPVEGRGLDVTVSRLDHLLCVQYRSVPLVAERRAFDQALSNARGRQGVLAAIGRYVARLCGATSVAFAARADSPGELAVTWLDDAGGTRWTGTMPWAPEAHAVTSDLTTLEPGGTDWATLRPPDCATRLVLCPLESDATSLGVLVLGFPRGRRPVDPDHLRDLAVRCALALDRARLVDEVAALNADLDARVARRTFEMQKVLDHLEADTEALEAFASFVESAPRHTGTRPVLEHALVALAKAIPGGTTFHLRRRATRWTVDAQAGREIERGDVITWWTARRDLQERVLASSLMFLEARTSPAPALQGPFRSTVLVPVREAAEVVGVIGVGHDDATWSERQRALVQAVVRAFNLVRERAVHERLLQEKRAELEELNTELDAFAQSVSHDLRAPVRHVLGFADLVEKSIRRQDSLAALERLDVIRGAARRMDGLIDGFLALARFGSQPARRVAVPLRDVLVDVVDELSATAPGRLVDWQVGDLPVLMGDEILLRQVFANLVGNAFKYTRSREDARIEVRAARTERGVRIEVADNGVGFDPRYASRLFRPFQRLHRESEYEGHGVGLATVARIVRRLGGWTTATGSPERGAVFAVEFPLASIVTP